MSERYRENSGCKSVNGRVIYSAWFSYVFQKRIFIAMAIWIDNVEMSFSSFVLYKLTYTHTHTILSSAIAFRGLKNSKRFTPTAAAAATIAGTANGGCCSAAAATWFYLLFLTQKKIVRKHYFYLLSKIYDFESWLNWMEWVPFSLFLSFFFFITSVGLQWNGFVSISTRPVWSSQTTLRYWVFVFFFVWVLLVYFFRWIFKKNKKKSAWKNIVLKRA